MTNKGLFTVAGVAVAVLIVLLVMRCGSGGALDYVGSWQKAQALAAETNKPILLNFGGPW